MKLDTKNNFFKKGDTLTDNDTLYHEIKMIKIHNRGNATGHEDATTINVGRV